MTIFYGCLAIIAIALILLVIDTACWWHFMKDKGFMEDDK